MQYKKSDFLKQPLLSYTNKWQLSMSTRKMQLMVAKDSTIKNAIHLKLLIVQILFETDTNNLIPWQSTAWSKYRKHQSEAAQDNHTSIATAKIDTYPQHVICYLLEAPLYTPWQTNQSIMYHHADPLYRLKRSENVLYLMNSVLLVLLNPDQYIQQQQRNANVFSSFECTESNPKLSLGFIYNIHTVLFYINSSHMANTIRPNTMAGFSYKSFVVGNPQTCTLA